MKKVILIIGVFSTASLYSQVSIGKTGNSSPSVSMEFGNVYSNSPVSNTEAKGLVLPWVDGTSNSAPFITGYSEGGTVANGTMVFDASNGEKKVKVKYASGWKDLSIQSGTTVDPVTSVDGLSIQTPLTEQSDSKALIGGDAATDATPGILVLGDQDKAMVLPKVASPHLNIVNPSPGMMVYDTVTKQLAVYNGSVWTFWKG